MSVRSRELFRLWHAVLTAFAPPRDLPQIDQVEGYLITRDSTLPAALQRALDTAAITFDGIADDELHWMKMAWGLEAYLGHRCEKREDAAAWPMARAAALHCCIAAGLERLSHDSTEIALCAAAWAGVTACPQVLDLLLVAIPASQLLLDRNDKPSYPAGYPIDMHLPEEWKHRPPEPAPVPITTYLASILVAKAIGYPRMAQGAVAGAIGIVDDDPLLTPVRGLFEAILEHCSAWGQPPPG